MALTKVTGDFIKDGVLTQAHLHSSHGITSSHIGEGDKLFFTNARARGAISVSGNALSYNSSTGVITSNFEESPTFSGNVVINGSGSSGNAINITRGSDGTTALRVQNSGEVVTQANYFYASASGVSMYVQNTAVFRGSIMNDTSGAAVRIGDALTIDDDLTVTGGGITLGGTGRIQGIDTVSAGTDAANKTYVDNQVAGIVDSAPSTLDTLNELAAALGDDANFSTTVTNSIATKLPLAGGTLSGFIQLNANELRFDQSGTRSWNVSASGGNLNINSGDSLGNVAISSGLTVADDATFPTVQISSGSSYNENIRMFPGSNGYSSLILGAVAGTSGTGAGQWSLVRFPNSSSNKFTIRHNSTDHVTITTAGNATFAGTVTWSGGSSTNANTAYGWGNHASAGYLTSFTETNGFLGDGGNASTHPGTSRLIYSGQVSAGSGVLGMPTSNNANAFINLNKHSGEYNSQLGFSSDGNIYYRNFNNAAINNSTAFRKIWDSGNDGSGSGLDADLLDGQHASAFASSSHTHAASDITSGNLAAARNTVNLANVASSSDASGVYFRSANEVISGEGWATAQYAYNHNDGFLFLNRNSSSTAFPTFHIGGWNNAGYAGYSDADGLLTLTRSDGTKSQGSTYAGTGLSNTSYYTNIIKTTTKTIFRDAQSLHEFTGNIVITGSGSSNSASLQIDNPDSNNFNHSIEAFAANLTNGESNVLLVGKEGSTKNAGYLGYYWVSSGSNNNYVSLGHWAADHLFRVYGDQVLSTVTLRSDVDMQAPIFYDKDNTGYYVNPNSTTSLKTVGSWRSDSSTWDGEFNGKIQHHSNWWYMQSANGVLIRNSSGANTITLSNSTGQITANADVRSPQFYDSADTSYILDLNGSSHIRKIAGVRTNLATSEGWGEVNAWNTGTQTGYFGGSFTINGSSNENNISWEDGPSGTRPTNKKELVWKVTTNSSDSGADGGWNKTITGIDYNKSHVSILYVKRIADGNGNFYHGTTTCLNLSGSTNSNPYFQAIGSQSLPLGVWCVSIGFLRANNDTASTAATSWSGVYRLDTGERILGATDYRLAQSTTSQHRTFLYYATNTATELWFANPGFYEINGNEPSLNEILMRPEDRTDSLRADVDMRAPLYYDSNDTSYYVDAADQSRMKYLNLGTSPGSGITSGYIAQIRGNMHMTNSELNYVSQLHFNDNVRFYDNGDDSYLNFVSGDSNTVGIKFYSGGGFKGYVYGDSGGFGLLDSDGSWSMRIPIGGSGLELRSNNNVEFTVNDDHTLSHGSSRAPIFYDSNNTAYYVDPTSTSRLLNLDFGASGYYIKAGDWGPRIQSPYGWIQFGPANTSHAHIYTDRSNFYFNAQIQLLGGSLINQNDIRAGVFYDVNNTAYYVDPASTSNLNVVNTAGAVTTQNAYYSNDGLIYDKDDTSAYYRATGTSTPHGDIFFQSTNRIWWNSQNTSSNYFAIQGGVSSGAYIDFNATGSTKKIHWRQFGSHTRFTMDMSSAAFVAMGPVSANGSDSRLKENIVTIDGALAKVKAMRGVYYNRIDLDTERRRVGVIAQEIETVLPEVVDQVGQLAQHPECDDDEIRAVSYGNISAVLIEAIKEQQTIIDDLKSRLETLENQ